MPLICHLNSFGSNDTMFTIHVVNMANVINRKYDVSRVMPEPSGGLNLYWFSDSKITGWASRRFVWVVIHNDMEMTVSFSDRSTDESTTESFTENQIDEVIDRVRKWVA